MKRTTTKSLSPIMERHTPQHPLPEEIKKLPEDETVCQFCGVSYLIHHEIKKLEELVSQLEEELEDSRGAVEREQKLRVELDKSKKAINSLNEVIKEKDKAISKIANEVEEIKTENNKLQADLSAEQQKRKKLSSSFLSYKQKVKSFLTTFHVDTNSIKSDLSKLRTDSTQMKTELCSIISGTIVKIPDYAKACLKDYAALNSQTEKLKSNIDATSSEIEAWKAKSAEQDVEILSLKKNLESSDEHREKREDELNEKVIELEKKCTEYSQSAKVSEMQAKTLQADTAFIEEKLKKKQLEVQSISFKLQKSEENATSTIRRITQECRDIERDLIASRQELQRLREAQREKEKREQELSKQATLNNFQVEEIKKALDEAKSTNQNLIEERSLMVMSHQNQIQQLRDNFKRMLAESDGSARSQRELDELRDKHREELDALEKNLKSEFHIELDVEKDKNSEAMSNMKTRFNNDIRLLRSNHESELTNYKNQCAALTEKLRTLNENAEMKHKECEEEKTTLKSLISQLEERITQLTGEQEDDAALKKLEVVSVNQKLQEAIKENEKLEESIMAMKEEISLLQDTVRRECEERYELTEALSQARQQVKDGKAFKSPSPNSINPVSAVNKLNPGAVEAEISNKLSHRTLRSLEADYSSPTPGQIRNGSVPSLRSLPDVLPRREMQQYHSRSAGHPDTNALSTSITDLSFGTREIAPRRSSSNSSLQNGHSNVKSSLYSNGSKGKLLSHSESAESVDNARRRIAAAIKRK